MRHLGKQTWMYENRIYLNASGTAVGPKEAKGPLADTFDKQYEELHCNEANWELAERKLMEDSVEICLQKANMSKEQIDIFLAGDLLNQNVTSNYVARTLSIPFLCMFGACSTSMETLAVGSALVDAGFANHIVAAVSSHNATAERQFRYPTEYGGQKPKTMTSTVTGAGAGLVSKVKSQIRIECATIGRVMDFGTKDPFDMGSAMAPAAYDTIKHHFEDTGRKPEDYDLIVTGDLSSVGSPILKDMLKEDGYNMEKVHNDCGLMVYNSDQNVLAGGSGCACSAVVTYGHIVQAIQEGRYHKVLVVATGALMSPTMVQQKETIPTIAHGVVLMREDGEG
ncbi:stage V sporulation protein AD [Pontibacillus salicampi]|uniref:Stage V sporulation protein AD n=1 Tax=Pontibacillus salicampi TaxID=1449801 RepID=A0ABV6LL00_9BACI